MRLPFRPKRETRPATALLSLAPPQDVEAPTGSWVAWRVRQSCLRYMPFKRPKGPDLYGRYVVLATVKDRWQEDAYRSAMEGTVAS